MTRGRLVDTTLRACLDAHPIILITGPRACGKTTTATHVAGDVIRLDRGSEAAVFRADAAAALASFPAHPLLLDEWQEVPEIMPALKAAADTGAPPGRFILTGSVRPEPGIACPATGRLIELRLSPLTMREMTGDATRPGLVAALIEGHTLSVDSTTPLDLGGYIDLALAGGFPHPALALGEPARRRWYDSYVDQVTGRDALTVLRRADPDRVRRYMEAYALHSGCVVDHKTLFDAAGINRKTAEGYEAILCRLFVTHAVPAWSTNRLRRLVRPPKRFVIDAGLMAAAARIGRADVMRDGGLMGRLIETFVHAQLAPELAARHPSVRLYHLRTDSGGRHEVDFILDLGGNRIIAIEVKSAAGPTAADARHLAWLRDQLRDDFIEGVLLHTGNHVYPLGDRLRAIPIRALWQA